VIAEEARARHRHAFPDRPVNGVLETGGQYQWRDGGEFHLFNPQTIHKLQIGCRLGSYKIFKEYADLINNQAANLCTLRPADFFKPAEKPLPIEEVEPIAEIVKRFKTGAMSYARFLKRRTRRSPSRMNRIGGKSNTGEGGEDPERYVPMPNGDSKNSAIKQVASRTVRRDEPLPRQCEGTPNQDGAGREAGRRRRAAGPARFIRGSPRRDSPRRASASFAAAAPRHLFHRGSGGVDSRFKKTQTATRASA